MFATVQVINFQKKLGKFEITLNFLGKSEENSYQIQNIFKKSDIFNIES